MKEFDLRTEIKRYLKTMMQGDKNALVVYTDPKDHKVKSYYIGDLIKEI